MLSAILILESFVSSVKVLIAGLPESLGLLVFGIALVVLAVIIRAFLARTEDNEKSAQK